MPTPPPRPSSSSAPRQRPATESSQAAQQKAGIHLTIYDLHTQFALVVVIANGVAGGWALAAHRFIALRRRALWLFIGLAEVSIFVEVAFGVAVVDNGRPIQKFHAFYGFLAIIAVGIIYSYRLQLKGKTYLLYGGGSLFVMGLCIRAMLLDR